LAGSVLGEMAASERLIRTSSDYCRIATLVPETFCLKILQNFGKVRTPSAAYLDGTVGIPALSTIVV
jgi:hypothetical protein